jgi:WD40 repeat protein
LTLSGKQSKPIGDGVQGYHDMTALAVSADGRLAALGDTEGRVRLWEIASGKEQVPTQGHQSAPRSVALSPDGRRAASAGASAPQGQVILWDVLAGKARESFFTPSAEMARAVAFSPDGAQLLAGDSSGNLHLCDAGSGQRLRPPVDLKVWVNSLCYVSERQVLVGGRYGQLLLWDSAGDKPARRLDGHGKAEVWCVAAGGQGKQLRLASATSASGPECTVKVWDGDGRLRHTLTHRNALMSVAVSPDGQWLASASHDRTVCIWKMDNLDQPYRVLTQHADTVKAVVFFPNSKLLASAGDDGLVQVRRVEDDRPIRSWRLPGPVVSLAVDGEGRHLLTGNANGTVYILRLLDPPSEPGR